MSLAKSKNYHSNLFKLNNNYSSQNSFEKLFKIQNANEEFLFKYYQDFI